MLFKNLCILILISVSLLTEAASSGVSDTASLKALGCIADCSRIILETDFDPARNKVIAGDQALMMINLLSSLPGDNTLRAELITHGMSIDPKVFAEYARYLARSGLADTYITVLLPSTLDPASVPPMLREFGADIQLILDETRAVENAERINIAISESTRGLISRIVEPIDLRLVGVSAFTATCLKALWDTPFKKEVIGPFETVKGSKSVIYLQGVMNAGYKCDAAGEVISIPLKNGAQFVVYKPARPSPMKKFLSMFREQPLPTFFQSSMLAGLEQKKLSICLPKLTLRSYTDLNEVFTRDLTSASKRFWHNELEIGKFAQSIVFNTTRRSSSCILLHNSTFYCPTGKYRLPSFYSSSDASSRWDVCSIIYGVCWRSNTVRRFESDPIACGFQRRRVWIVGGL